MFLSNTYCISFYGNIAKIRNLWYNKFASTTRRFCIMRRGHSKIVQTLGKIDILFHTTKGKFVTLTWNDYEHRYQFYLSGDLKGEVISFSYQPGKDYTRFVIAYHPYKNYQYAPIKVCQFSCNIREDSLNLRPVRW